MQNFDAKKLEPLYNRLLICDFFGIEPNKKSLWFPTTNIFGTTRLAPMCMLNEMNVQNT